MNAHRREHRDTGFTIGLWTGTFVGAGLAMWLVPRVERAIDEIARKGQNVRDEVADAVAHGAHEVERFAAAARSDRADRGPSHSAADRAASKSLSL
jgi:hypothetical protein